MYIGSESFGLAERPVTDTASEGKTDGLRRATAQVKAYPNVRAPPHVMVMESEGGKVYPPTVAYDAPNHVLAVAIGKGGKPDAYVYASPSNLFGYRLGHAPSQGNVKTSV